MNYLRGFRNGWRIAVVALCASFLLFGGSADALPLIDLDFGTGGAGQGGTVVIGGGQAVGAGILVDTLTYFNEYLTPSSTLYDLSGAGSGLSGSTAVLSFSTGGAGGNFIKIVGGVPTLGIPDDTLLLSGYFTDYSFSGGSFGVFYGTGYDLKSNLLLSVLDLPTNLPFDFAGFTLGLTNGQAGTYIAKSTDVVNKVPGPSMLVALGAGLLLLAAVARKLTN